MRISDWSADVCSSDLLGQLDGGGEGGHRPQGQGTLPAAAPGAHRARPRAGAEGPAAAHRPRARRGAALRQGGLNRKKLDLAAALPKVPATMELQFHNTLTRRKERFAPLDPQHVRMYVCGPTVYDFAHIGNARPGVVFELLFQIGRATV